uniref:Uncharacterized protein n=1 Tax=Anguilla anguilla TaxID=7936 RepID=A0A0E9UZG8_ANGAN
MRTEVGPWFLIGAGDISSDPIGAGVYLVVLVLQRLSSPFPTLLPSASQYNGTE